MVKALLQPVYTFIVLLSFVACLLVAFPLFFVLGMFNSAMGRKIIWYIVSYWAKGWLFLIGMPLSISGNRPDKDFKCVYVANHISYLDTIVIYAAIKSYFRTLAKKEMGAIPIFGFVYKQLTIMVDRSSAHSRAKSMRLMWLILKNECNVTIFPEGTFNETDEPLKDFYDGAFRLAINTQVPVVPILFPDTVRRWHYSAWWKLWPGRNRAIFLPPIPTKGLKNADLKQLKDKVHSIMAGELSNYGYPK
jgi:1-acyl-sn-glycerol-3-phosphate acyltransferase